MHEIYIHILGYKFFFILLCSKTFVCNSLIKSHIP